MRHESLRNGHRSRSLSRGAVEGLHALCFCLATISAAVFLLVETAGSPGVFDWGLFAGQAAACLGASIFIIRKSRIIGEPSGTTALLLLLLAMAYVWEPVSRAWLDSGRPLEILVMASLRNVTYGFAAFACRRQYQRWTALCSLFLVLFGATAGSSPAIHFLAAGYAVLGLAWLIGAHWDGLRGRFVAQRRALRPRWWVLFAAGFVIVAFICLAAKDSRATQALRGWLPSSGGNGRFSPYARSGVGGGDLLVAGHENIQSFAAIDDAPFLQDDQPSLYDLFDDLYDEPVTPRNLDRSIALAPELNRPTQSHLHSRTEQASREFSTLRKTGGGARGKPADDISSPAMLFVAGRTPLHLRLELFDEFDGVQWKSESLPELTGELQMRMVADRPWLGLPPRNRSLAPIAVSEAHALKIMNLDTNRIPSPLHLQRIHIDLVDRCDMFAMAQDGLVKMQREELPRLTTIHLVSETVDSRGISSEFPILSIASRNHGALPPLPEMTPLRQLAEEWVAGSPRGWPQIEAIAGRLRRDYRHDRALKPPEDVAFPLAYFLMESKAGPDYLFASAAAVLLRSLGYSARLVSGFYATPAKYEPRHRHTRVDAEDVHFWAEVHLGGGVWGTVEATPGYEVLSPPLGLMASVLAAVLEMLQMARDHWRACGLAGLFVFGAWITRHRWQDLLATINWRLWALLRPHGCEAAAWSVLERRLRWSGLTRPPGMTPRRWCRWLIRPCADQSGDLLLQLVSACERTAFGPVRIRNDHAIEAARRRRLCAAVLREWSLSRWQQLRLERPSMLAV